MRLLKLSPLGIFFKQIDDFALTRRQQYQVVAGRQKLQLGHTDILDNDLAATLRDLVHPDWHFQALID
ncbi:hypothetical protein D3C76_1599890 [compost metagenome]